LNLESLSAWVSINPCGGFDEERTQVFYRRG
jgi:hypothetical protein